MKKLVLCFLLCFNICACTYKPYKDFEEYYILEMKNQTLTLAPSNYDGDAKEMFEDKIIQKELADKVKYYDVVIHTTVKNDIHKTKVNKKKITKQAIEEAIEYDYAYVRVTYDENGKIDTITLWGELIIYE